VARNLDRVFVTAGSTTRALDDVSLELYPGEASLVMGPSGSGKSTLLSVLSGLSPPDRGSVVAMGSDLTRMTDVARKRFRLKYCGFVFQGHNLFPALTAREQLELILLWGERVSPNQARKEADRMLSLLGLTKQASLRPHQLSGGEKQRVAIGRALIKKPKLCFADEPTSALDWERGKMVVNLLRDVARQENSTVMLVSHDARVQSYMDRTFHMEDGRLIHEEPGRPGSLSGGAGDGGGI
jgi:putative ABC transport system ATP-binding protein